MPPRPPLPLFPSFLYPTRHLSTQSTTATATATQRQSPSASPPAATPTTDPPSNPRFLAVLKRRIGHCITFGLTSAQTVEAGALSRDLARSWRDLIAGAEGYLTGPGRRGLWRQEVVWGEMDSMGHVNNVTYNRYAESARVNWAQNFANHLDPEHKAQWSELWTPRGKGMILRSIRTDFKFPMTWPDHVTVLHKLRSAPTASTDSFTLDVLILSELHQRPAARCVEDIVVYDYRASRKVPLPPFVLDQFMETWELQEQARSEWAWKREELERRVRELERASWDREGAVEQFGVD